MEHLGPQPPVIIRRSPRRGHEEHGGAWKVAMADFALAMMALFLVLWIISNSTEAQRQAISGYFADPQAFIEGRRAPSAAAIDLGGSPSVLANIGQSGNSDAMINRQPAPDRGDDNDQQQQQQQQQEVYEQLERLILASPALSPFRNQLLLDITTDGLRLQIVDRQQRPLFESGQAVLTYYAEDMLWELAPVLAASGLRLSITGHTDAYPASPSGQAAEDSNWLLSAQRADAARRALMEAGVSKPQIAQVIGMGDTAPYDRSNPQAPVNRRIALLLLNRQRSESLSGNEALQDGEISSRSDGGTAADSTLQRVQQQRNQPDNSYDNPPNQME